MVGSYNYGLVVLSVVISIIASYAALDLAGRVTSARGRTRLLWLTGGAAAMGIGIWSMHYIGMLAFHLPVPVQYDWPTVLLSLLAAILASAVALFVVSRRKMGLSRALVGSLFMGAGIAAMHYIGMAAMRLPAMYHYSPAFVTLSVGLAIAISFVALWLTFHFRGETAAWGWMKITSALVMGAAIPVMHYTGMAAASFAHSSAVDQHLSHAVSISSLGTTGIVGATAIVLGLVLLTSLVDRRFSLQITGRQQAEAALIDSERTYGLTFDAVPIGIAHMALDGRWLRVNDRLCELLGYSCEQLMATDLPSLTHPDDVEVSVEARRQLRAGTIDRYTQQKRYRRGDGQFMWASVTVSVNRDAAGQRTHFVTMIEDITERRNLEEQFRQAQKMEAIGQLAGGMAHDFNNILGCIMGYTELVAAHMSASDPMQENLDEVIKASQRAKELILQILTFSRQQVVERRPMSLLPVVKEALKFVRALLPSTIDIDEHLDADVPAVLADSTQIHQIIMNLATNAAHAMKDHGGRLKIELSAVSVDASTARTLPNLRAGRYVRLLVSDSGCGMNAAIQQHIFEPFFTTKAPGEGTGLGLSVVHGIMTNHGGAITVSSAPDTGTTFTLYFPSGGTAAPAIVSRPSTSVRGHGEHILFVDDEPALASLGKKVLEQGGYRVTACTSPLDALAAFRSDPDGYDLVITDLTMPNLTGTALAVELLTLRADVPIILTTGFARLMSQEQAFALGIRALLMKPVGVATLIDGVHRALEPQELIQTGLR
jgi:PAS domain S-box-containing protein